MIGLEDVLQFWIELGPDYRNPIPAPEVIKLQPDVVAHRDRGRQPLVSF